MTTVARGRCTSAPAPVEMAIGTNPRLATAAVISGGGGLRGLRRRKRGRLGGAAAGAAIGAIAGDAGKGAAIGAITGGLGGRRASIQGKAAQSQSNQQAAANQSAALLNDYKKAFSVCMEGKGYTIK